MRVLHFYSYYHPDTFGGGEQLINGICRGAAVYGVQSTVLTLSNHPDPVELEVDGHRVVRCKIDFSIRSNRFSFGAIGRLRELAGEADVLNYHYPWPFGDFAHFCAGIRKPFVVSYLSDIVKQKLLATLYRPLQNRFLGAADAIVATSPNYLATSEVLQRYRDKVRLIPIGLDPDEYRPAPAALKARWQAELGGRFFLFVGVLRYYKGLEYLLEAVRGTGIPVVIVGSGPMQATLHRQARLLGLDQVRFLGRVDEADKRVLLELCYGLVFPSHLRSESFGVSLLEAACYGKPLVSCEIGTGTSYVNAHGITGLVIKPADAAELRAALRRLWDDPALASELGRHARERFLELFQAGDMAAKYVRLYEEVARKHIG